MQMSGFEIVGSARYDWEGVPARMLTKGDIILVGDQADDTFDKWQIGEVTLLANTAGTPIYFSYYNNAGEFNDCLQTYSTMVRKVVNVGFATRQERKANASR